MRPAIWRCFGTSERCIATYPGDWATALAAFDTTVEVASPEGRRTIPFLEFHVAYGDDPARETVLEQGEIVTAILVKATPAGRKSTYLKVRDRQSYAYAVASAAVALELDGDRVVDALVSIGGVATKPWRATAAADVLRGKTISEAVALEAGDAAFAGAEPRGQNACKIDIGRNAVAKAVFVAAGRN